MANTSPKNNTQNAQSLYYNRTVSGDFARKRKKSMSRITEAKTLSGNTEPTIEEDEEAFGANFIAKKAGRYRGRSVLQKKSGGRMDFENEHKLEGPVFWIMVMLAITKDTLDLLFGISFFLSFFSSIFAIITGLLFVFYFTFNNVSFTTRKVVSFVGTTIFELLPIFSAILPLTTANLLIIQRFENDDRSRSSSKKRGEQRESLIKKLQPVSQ